MSSGLLSNQCVWHSFAIVAILRTAYYRFLMTYIPVRSPMYDLVSHVCDISILLSHIDNLIIHLNKLIWMIWYYYTYTYDIGGIAKSFVWDNKCV